MLRSFCFFFFFFNDRATTEIYTLSLPDALPISLPEGSVRPVLREPSPAIVPVESTAMRRRFDDGSPSTRASGACSEVSRLADVGGRARGSNSAASCRGTLSARVFSSGARQIQERESTLVPPRDNVDDARGE